MSFVSTIKELLRGGQSTSGGIVNEKNSTKYLTNTEKCEIVRQNLLVKFCTNYVSRQLSRIEYTVKPKGIKDWQFDYWSGFVKKDWKELIWKIYPQAWAYNFAYADTCFKGDPAVPDHFVIMQTKNVQDNNPKEVLYKGFKVPREYAFYLEMRDRRDKPHALDLFDHVDWLRRCYKSEANGTTIHSQGIHWLKYLGDSTGPSEKEKRYAQDWLDSIGTAEIITGSHSKYEPMTFQSPALVTADAAIMHNRQAILTDFDMLFLDVATWTSGTYASVRMQMRGFLDMVDSEADTMTKALKGYAKQIAEINDCELSVDFDHSVPRLEEDPKLFLDTLQMAKGMSLTKEEMDYIYPAIGLPIPEAKMERQETSQEVVQETPKLSKAESELKFQSGTNYLKSKMDECLNGFVITINKKREKNPNVNPYKIGKVAEGAYTLGLDEAVIGGIYNEYSVKYRNLIDKFVMTNADDNVINLAFKGYWHEMCHKIEEVRKANGRESV